MSNWQNNSLIKLLIDCINILCRSCLEILSVNHLVQRQHVLDVQGNVCPWSQILSTLSTPSLTECKYSSSILIRTYELRYDRCLLLTIFQVNFVWILISSLTLHFVPFPHMSKVKIFLNLSHSEVFQLILKSRSVKTQRFINFTT